MLIQSQELSPGWSLFNGDDHLERRIAQGVHDDCWLVAGLQAISRSSSTYRVLFRPSLIPGRHEVVFRRFGSAVHVVVDDLLPAIDGEMLCVGQIEMSSGLF